MAKKMLHTKAEVLKAGIKAEEGILEAVVGSTNVLDRMGDIITQAGWDLKYYKKTNPVILWGHNRKEDRPPIGKALRVWIEDKGEKTAKLMFKVKFDLQDNFAKEILRKIKDGFINTVSVGFKPIEWEELSEDDPFGGRRYTKQELLELSFVPVPANPEAVVALKEMDDPRFNPVKLEDLYPAEEDEVEKEEKKKVKKIKKIKKVKKVKKVKIKEKEEGDLVTDIKPFPNEHSCRLRNPADFKAGSFRRTKRKHDGKEYSIIMGRLKGKTTMTEQAYRYAKSTWATASARSHCKSHKGSFEPATGKEKEKEIENKGVLPFKDMGTLPESAGWDGPGEIARAEVSDLKLMCTWFDSEKPDAKSSYKLPHHKADGHKTVWRGVAAAMATLLGARGGIKIPDSDRKGIYNHLKKHYKQFDKDVPSFKAVEDQVLKGFGEEIHALILDREDKYMIRLIKKVLKEQKEVKKIKTKEIKITKGYTPKQIRGALELLDMALSGYKVDSPNGGEKKG